MAFSKQHAIKCPKLYGDGCTCDSYHTFDEFIELYIALCKYIGHHCQSNNGVWRSKCHSDGELAFGGSWFVLGIGKEKKTQIFYHIPIERWNETMFAETLDIAPKFDGHTSDDVIERLKRL